ncbi:MAG: hypothetical protein MAG451_01374 [Anaerolineales bacterium]|nr:hypothetical protein [Anaerolineales bacterium]
MYHKRKAWAVVPFLLILLVSLSAGCGGEEPESLPTQTAEPTATQAPTATEPPASPTVKAATATETMTQTATPDESAATPTAATEAGESGEEIVYELPVKGDPDAPVTIIEFSDYL